MNTNKNLIILVILVFIASCRSTLIVTNGEREVAGIPFYSQKEVIQQETQYLYNWIEISLIKEETVNNKTRSFNIHTAQIKGGQDLMLIASSIVNVPKLGNRDSVKRIINMIESLDKVSLEPDSIFTINVIQNSWKRLVSIDYSNIYYINSKMPWLGSSTLTQKLSKDGTLSESTSTVDSQLDEAIGAIASIAVPLSNIKVAAIETAAIKRNGEVPDLFQDNDLLNSQSDNDRINDSILNSPKENSTYELKLVEKGYVYIYTKDLEPKQVHEADIPIKFDVERGNYKRLDWPIQIKEDKKKKKPTIDISASIQLPEG